MRVFCSIIFFLFSFIFNIKYVAAEANLEIIVSTATRIEEDKDKLIGSIDSISVDELALINHQHIQQSLLRVPGVNLHRGNGQEYLPAIRSPVLTGAGACGAFLTAEDGIPLRAAGFCNVNELFEGHTEQAKRIEVFRGPVSSLYGSNALHGMVNIITPEITEAYAAVEIGENDYVRLKAASKWADKSKGAENQFSALMTVTHDGGFREQSGFNQQKLTFRYSNQQSGITGGLSLNNLDQETAGFITGLNAYQDSALIRSNPNPEAFRDAQSVRGWLRFDKQIDDNKRLLITPFVRYTEMDFLQHFLPGDPLEQNGQKSVGVQSAYHIDLSNSNRLIAGVDLEYTDAYLIQSQQQPTQGSAFLMETIPVGLHYDYEVKASVYAPFIYLDRKLSNSLQLITGFRYEYTRYNYDNRMLPGRTRADGSTCGFGGCRYSRPEDSVDSFDNWSSHMGLVYKNKEGNRFYINAARSFRVPQATELYRLQRSQNKADLDSVSLKNIELGMQSSIGNFKYNVALYRQNKDNFIFRDSNFFNQSNGKTKHQGIEISGFMPLNERFNVSANLSYAKHQYNYHQVLSDVDIFENDVDTAPRVFGSMQLAYQISESSQAELEWVHMGEYYMDPENLHQYQGHDLLNLRIQKEFQSGLQLSARLTNIANKRYAERADFTSFTNERYFPGQPRTGFIELKKYF